MRTSPEVTDVSGTMREAQNRNTSPSKSCSGAMMSTGGRAAASGDWIWFSSNSQRSDTPGRTSQMPMERITSPPSSRSPISRVLPTSPSASRVTRHLSGRHSPPAGRIVVFIVSPFLVWGMVETGHRTPRAFVPLRSTAGRRPLHMCIGGAPFACKSDGFCVLPMANRRRRTVCTSRRFDDGRAEKTRFYFVGRMRFNISISPSRYVLAARLRS